MDRRFKAELVQGWAKPLSFSEASPASFINQRHQYFISNFYLALSGMDNDSKPRAFIVKGIQEECVEHICLKSAFTFLV